MSENTTIEWADHTANLWWGCVEVAPECDNCYAREWAKRFDKARWGAHEPRLEMPGVWASLKRMQADAAKAGTIKSVFVGSMMDIAEKEQPVVDSKGEPRTMMTSAIRQNFFGRIDAGLYPNLLFLLLSKRPQNYPAIIPLAWRDAPPANVMFGATAGTQKSYDANVAALKSVKGRRFLSCEPMLERIIPHDLDGIHWLICGGESGPKARPMHPDWARELRDKSVSAGVRYLFKQWGEHVPYDNRTHPLFDPSEPVSERLIFRLSIEGHHIPVGSRWCPTDSIMYRAGKKAAGRLLDGREWNELPDVLVPSEGRVKQ